jgi:LmbE family N-acetylglucosaminyl deacetylase
VKTRFFFLTTALALASTTAFAQREISGAVETKLALERLEVLGSVLMIAAHPDDENTAVLAYFARGRKLRTGYLSVTRGEGGQNLIGSEQGDELGVIRTQELLAARRIDGAEQFFTRAIDFGFSKTADETLAKWGRSDVLGDVVWIIRKFRPDVVMFRFSGTPRDGHGHHQSSAILGKEAVEAAGDPNRYPDQLKYGVEVWKPRRAVFNFFAFTKEQEKEAETAPAKVGIDVGDYDKLLGHSYGEIAGMSRSMHRSQGMGSAERKGSQPQYFITVGGDPAKQDLFDGINTTWDRVGAEQLTKALHEITVSFDAEHPEKTIPKLLAVRPQIAAMKNEWAGPKLRELDEAVALCSGLALEAIATQARVPAGGSFQINASAINRSDVPARLLSVTVTGAGTIASSEEAAALADNKSLTRTLTLKVPADQPDTAPYWLANPKKGSLYGVTDQRLIGRPENDPLLEATFKIELGGQVMELRRPVVNRYVDRVYGEHIRPVVVVPPVGVMLLEKSIVATSSSPRTVEAGVTSYSGAVSGSVSLKVPAGWTVAPASVDFALTETGEQKTLKFELTPSAKQSIGMLEAVATVGNRQISETVETIQYPHIPTQTLFPVATAQIARVDCKTLVKSIGYVPGAGDEMVPALKQLGLDVTLLSTDDLTRGNLSKYDAIVTGVRAWNVRTDLRANQQRLLDYMQAGGTLLVQYNVLEGFGPGNPGDPKQFDKIGPYPIQVSRDRVTVEDAPVTLPNPQNPLLHSPNQIVNADFDGWVQERGLYFATKWDSHYTPLFECHDPGEKPQEGGTLVTKYGKGAYVFTPMSWFRELPAGVPGAYRIFANLLSAGKVL